MSIDLEKMYQHLEDTIRQYNPGANFDMIRSAYEYAKQAHEGQLRKDGTPYITHPINVAQIVAEELRLDSESIAAALLHDTIEDTATTYDDVAKRFSPTVAEIVDGLSKLSKVSYSSVEEEQMENLRKMLLAMSKDIRVILIKIADRLHNMRTMAYMTPAKQKKKSLETMEIYAPIAHRLGMQKIKWELEDLSLKFLDPAAYNEIESAIAAKSAEHENFISSICEQLRARTDSLHINADIYGRIKHIYSVYRKMYTKDKSLDDVFDLYAFRVIVDTIPECYNVLGIVHDLYKPILGRFKDYIATPKQNLYQSLHTTVMSQDAVPFEVQIRTKEMHEVAEYGIAAHWKYKQGIVKEGEESGYEWVRRLLENQEGADAEEYIHSLRVDMFADEVFVFTPQGDVINLPAGATPIDFAYNIHSAVGNSMIAAKVNGHIVTFDSHLENGDVVEIVTSKAARGPSRDWIQIAKSNNARSKIRQWFKKEKREENIVTGRALFESELKRAGVSLKEITDDEFLSKILDKLCYNSLDDMYAAIGYGGVSAIRLVGRLKDIILTIKKRHTDELEAQVPVASSPDIMRPAVPKRENSTKGVVVEGLSNCLVKFAKCCTPVPGDDIIGFITKGYGVSIHRTDCPNADPNRNPESEKGRWIKVSWVANNTDSYRTSLQIHCKDRINLIADISAVLSTTKTSVSSLNARATTDGYGIIDLDILISDGEQLKTLMSKLAQIPDILTITRPTG